MIISNRVEENQSRNLHVWQLEIYISRGEERGSHLCLFWSRTWISIRICQLSLHRLLSLSSCVPKFDVCQGVFHAVVVVYIVKFLLFNNVVNIWLIDWCLWCIYYTSEGLVWFIVFNATFNNISVISWWSVLLVEETRVPGENYWFVESYWQTLSHNHMWRKYAYNNKKV